MPKIKKQHSLEIAISRYSLNSTNRDFIKELTEHLKNFHPLDFLRKKLQEIDPSQTKLPASRFSNLYWKIRGYSDEESIQHVKREQGKNGSFEEKRKKLANKGFSSDEIDLEIKKLAKKRSKINSDSHRRAQEKDPTYLRSMSHQCPEFWIKKGFSEEEAKNKAAEICEKNRKKFREKLDSGEIQKGWNNTTLEYYLKKGMSLDEAKESIINRQKTFTLEKCISKYGETIGREKWKARQEKWFSNYRKKSYSFVSQELFWKIQDELQFPSEEIAFATFDNGNRTETVNLNKEARLYLDNRVVLPDFIHFPSKKIIEFDGVYYHRNTPENKPRELQRDEDLKRNGYTVFHVNEKEYKLFPEEAKNKCKQFLMS